MDPDLLLPPCQINLPNIKAKEIGDNESYIENNFTEDDLEKSAYNRKVTDF